MDPNITVSGAPSLMGDSIPTSPEFSTPAMPHIMGTEPSSGMNWGKIALYASVVVVLAILGFNLFNYLGNATDSLSKIFGPLASFFGKGITGIFKQTIDVSAEGTKGIINTSTGAIDSGLNSLEGRLSTNIPRNKIDDTSKDTNGNTNGKSVGTSQQKKGNNEKPAGNESAPQPDEAGSRTQGKPGKAGYCYIGEDRGFRSCIKVGEDDTCMSGKIFPSKDLCINPELRE